MKNSKSGSILIYAIVAVSVATLLSVGLSMWLRPQLKLAQSTTSWRYDIDSCYKLLNDYSANVLDTDTNGIDHLNEDWHLEYTNPDIPNAVIESEYPNLALDSIVNKGLYQGEPKNGADDEDGKYPINLELPGVVANLITILTETDNSDALQIEEEIAAMRPIIRKEQLHTLTSMTDEIYNAIVPYITTAPVSAVNINTAPEPVLKALFSLIEKYDSKASLTLSSKMLAYRMQDGYFTSTEATSINTTLSGLNQTELMVISACKDKITTESRYISGRAVCGKAQLIFTYDRSLKQLIRCIESDSK